MELFPFLIMEMYTSSENLLKYETYVLKSVWTPFTQRRWLYKTVTFVWTSVIFLKGVVWTAFTQKGMFRFFYRWHLDEIFRVNFKKIEGTRETVTFVWTKFTQSFVFLARIFYTKMQSWIRKRLVFLKLIYQNNMNYRPDRVWWDISIKVYYCQKIVTISYFIIYENINQNYKIFCIWN